MSTPKAPSLDAQVAALGIAFTELAKMLGRKQAIQVTQLATALESAAKALGVNEGTTAAVSELASRFR
jgi:phage antirepressor YoqD-like protein